MSDTELRKHLIQLLRGGQAHIRFEDAVSGFSLDKTGIRPAGSPHSAWELLEHIRIALEDIALFSGLMDGPPRPQSARELPKGYVALDWPGDYWPKSPAPEDADQWNRSVAAIEESLAAFARLIEDPKRDLFEPFPWGDGQTLLREALLMADHNAYHLGQLLLVRRMLELK
jgi:hypothetical protein